MSLRSRAPSRIDLAGGTLDIWPLYLLIEQAATVNIAIDLYAEVSLEPSKGGWRINEHRGTHDIKAATPQELEHIPGAEIAGALLRVFTPEEPLSIKTRSMAPARSGLGASSALGIALAGALNALTGFRYNRVELIEIVKNVEARILGAMTGVQDHYPPVFGGANCLWWSVHGVKREPLPIDGREFERRFLLAYTQQPHRSGVNNWEVIKRFLDGDDATREALGTIGRIAVQLREATLRGDMNEIATLVGREWEARKQLAPAVSSPETEKILEAAFAAGADAGKACGAGGGGCLLIASTYANRGAVEDAIRQAGGSLIPFHIAPQGLRLVNPDAQ
jgi:D-glycero-alpha-D-manno-heptose-7-phosphate kinase